MTPGEINLADLAATLEKSPDYRVLRRLFPRTEFAASNGQPTKIGILLDVETTGLDFARHEVIELGMVKFDYLADGAITRISEVFESFNEPSTPIPDEITELTGITDAMVAGHQLIRIRSPRSPPTPSSSSRIWPASTANSPNDTGRSSSTRLGRARLPKLSGASMGLTGRA